MGNAESTKEPIKYSAKLAPVQGDKKTAEKPSNTGTGTGTGQQTKPGGTGKPEEKNKEQKKDDKKDTESQHSQKDKPPPEPERSYTIISWKVPNDNRYDPEGGIGKVVGHNDDPDHPRKIDDDVRPQRTDRSGGWKPESFDLQEENSDLQLDPDVQDVDVDGAAKRLQECIRRLKRNPDLKATSNQEDVEYIDDCFSQVSNPKRCPSDKRSEFYERVLKMDFVEMVKTVWEKNFDEKLFEPNSKEYAAADILLSRLWHMCDNIGSGQKTCQRVIQVSFHKDMIVYLSAEPLKSTKLGYTNPRTHTAKGFCDILHRVAKKQPESIDEMREAKILPALNNARESNNVSLVSSALLTTAYVINEEENAAVFKNGKEFKTFNTMLELAIRQTPYHIDTLYEDHEVAEALNVLASMDSDVDKMLTAGILTHYVTMSKSTSHYVCYQTALGLWMMSLDGPSARDQLSRQQPGCLKGLKRLRKSRDSFVEQAADGAIAVLEEYDQKRAKQYNSKRTGAAPTPEDKKENMEVKQCDTVLVSCGEVTSKVTLLMDELKKAEFSVNLLDSQNADFVDARCSTIEDSGVVLVCVSRSYKRSPACRFDLNYANLLNKKCLTVILGEDKYVPDGWLAKQIADKNKYDLSKNDKAEKEKLKKEIEKALKPAKKEEKQKHSPATSRESSYTYDRAETDMYHEPKYWTNEQVLDWLERKNLKELQPEFKKVDGVVIAELIEMWKHARNAYFNHLFEQHHMTTDQAMLFTRELRILDRTGEYYC